MSRLADYGWVALVILVLMGLFRLSRILLGRIVGRFRQRFPAYTVDHLIVLGFLFLLLGLLALPLTSVALGFFDPCRLPGGMVLHLVMVAGSVILFSFSEDLFGSIRRADKERAASWSVGRHMRVIALPLLLFLVLGALFLSPIFYSALTIVLLVFYLAALWCRTACGKTKAG
ncbi:hypothetical protein JW921_11435 [Candidatus Fermentibacterales bacterium]|nr:hypothetical protein [Candidatus Fermentibacterales bacterium]